MIRALRVTLLMIILCGIIYPALVTIIGQSLFPYQANGSLVIKNDQIVGSALIGQDFAQDYYFRGRPSVAHYQTMPARSSNLVFTDPSVWQRIAQSPVTGCADDNRADLSPALMNSGSGLDPHITRAMACIQIPVIAAARQVSEECLRTVIENQPSDFLLNVLLLNMALDESCPRA